MSASTPSGTRFGGLLHRFRPPRLLALLTLFSGLTEIRQLNLLKSYLKREEKTSGSSEGSALDKPIWWHLCWPLSSLLGSESELDAEKGRQPLWPPAKSLAPGLLIGSLCFVTRALWHHLLAVFPSVLVLSPLSGAPNSLELLVPSRVCSNPYLLNTNGNWHTAGVRMFASRTEAFHSQ